MTADDPERLTGRACCSSVRIGYRTQHYGVHTTAHRKQEPFGIPVDRLLEVARKIDCHPSPERSIVKQPALEEEARTLAANLILFTEVTGSLGRSARVMADAESPEHPGNQGQGNG